MTTNDNNSNKTGKTKTNDDNKSKSIKSIFTKSNKTNTKSSKDNDKSNKNLQTVSDDTKETELWNNNSIQVSFNIIILGDNKSGKSNLVKCFLNKEFDNFNYSEDVFKLQVKKFLMNKVLFEVCLYEISGNYARDSEVMSEYLKNAHAYILCHSFDQTFKENNLKKWLNLINASNLNNCPVYLVGCKYDKKLIENIQLNSNHFTNDYASNLNFNTFNAYQGEEADNTRPNLDESKLSDNSETKQLSFEDHAKNFITINNIEKYFYTSALMNINVDTTFDYIIKNIIIDFVSKQKENKIQIEEKYKCVIF